MKCPVWLEQINVTNVTKLDENAKSIEEIIL